MGRAMDRIEGSHVRELGRPIHRSPVGRALGAAVLAFFASLPVGAAPKTMLEEAEALMKAGKAEAAYQLLEPEEFNSAGDSLYDYLLATAALESGKPSKATFVYERILAIDPSYIGVRADMGRAYFLLGDYARAKIEFETVLAFKSLPQDLRSQVEQYMAALDAQGKVKKTVATGYMEFGVGRDSNIGSSTGSTALILPLYPTTTYRPGPPTGLPTGTKTPDNYATFAVGGEVNHLLNDTWGVFAGGDYRVRDYSRYNDPNNYTLDGRAGVSYSGGAWLLRTSVLAGEYHYYAQRLRENIGINVDWRKALGSSSQITANGSYVRYSYVPIASLSQQVDTYTGTFGWLTALGTGSTIFNATLTAGNEKGWGQRDDGDRRFWGPRVLLQTAFTDTLGGYITAGASRSVYRGANTYYLVPRRETLTDVALALTWTIKKGVSLRPQVSYVKNASNAELYAYNKTDASLNLRFDY